MMFFLGSIVFCIFGVGMLIGRAGAPDSAKYEQALIWQEYAEKMQHLRSMFRVDIGCGYYQVQALTFEFYQIYEIFFGDELQKYYQFLKDEVIDNAKIPDNDKPDAMLVAMKRYKELYYDKYMEMAKGLCAFCEYKYIAYPEPIARLFEPNGYLKNSDGGNSNAFALSPYTDSTISALRGMGFTKKEATDAVAYANAELAGQEYNEGDFFKKALNALQG